MELEGDMNKRIRKLSQSEGFWAFVFLSIAVIGFVVFTVYPLIRSFYLSFTDWDFVHEPNFIGFQNYIDMLSDSKFIKVFKNTVVYTAVTVPLLIVLPLVLATALNQKIRGIRFFRAAYFIPVIASTVSISLIWQWMFNGDFGMVNYLLSKIGVSGPNWLTDKNFALVAVMFTSIWKNVGYNMMLFLAGLQNISSDYYEVASLEKITIWKEFRYITVPLLKPTTLFVAIITIINSFQVFDQVVVMTGGGPARASSVLVHYIYQNAFKFYNMGYASALGWVLAAIVFVLTLLQFAIMGKDDQ